MNLNCTSTIIAAAICLLADRSNSFAAEVSARPNVVVIFCDDLGYTDVGCFGAQGLETPNLDRMAKEGMRFGNFYAAQAVCSASRAALPTGCFPNRVGITGALMPRSSVGLSTGEKTIASLLKSAGYVTGMVGKWHLGDRPQFMPWNHGFDDYFGLPYANGTATYALYDLEADPGETTDVAAAHPNIVQELKKLAAAARQDLGDNLTQNPGTGRRKPGNAQPGNP